MVNDCLSGRKSSIFCAFAQASATKKAEPPRRGRGGSTHPFRAETLFDFEQFHFENQCRIGFDSTLVSIAVG